MTDEQRKVIAESAKQELAKRDLEQFLLYDGRGSWKTAKHLKMLCKTIMDVERRVREGKGARVMVFMPPRHGKSEVSTKKAPAFLLNRNPTWEIIISSYSADLAYDFSKIARNTFKEHSYLFGLELAKDSGAVGRWGIEGYRGGLAAAGVGGPITGRGAHVAIIDDPFKNWQDASSKTIRDNVWDWYRSTLRTRLAPGGAIFLVMTRWHEDDLATRLLKEAEADGEKWDVISLPAIAEENDILGRKEGEGLWPERFSREDYHNTKRAVGSKLWSALYQQKPSPGDGTIFKRSWFRFYKVTPKFERIIQSWDCTFKDSSSSDYVVGQIWGKIGADKYLLDQVRAKMSFTETIQAIKSLTAKWPQASAKYIEDKANGPAVISALEREIPGLIPVNPDGGKVVRAQAVSADYEAGNVFLPDPTIAPWIHDYIEEFVKFPNDEHDDQVDSSSQALNKLNDVKEKTSYVGPVIYGHRKG